MQCGGHIKKGEVALNRDLYIQHYCKIKANTLTVDDSIVIGQPENQELTDFLKFLYKYLELGYSKFFKMDKLSKLAFLASEVLLKEETGLENCAVVLSNHASSLETDRVYQASIEDKENYYPSPSVFVYTLPNITIGEICIRHKIHGENAFFVRDHFDPNFHHAYESGLLLNGKSDKILGGWVDVDGESYEAFLYLVSGKGDIPYEIKTLKEIYLK